MSVPIRIARACLAAATAAAGLAVCSCHVPPLSLFFGGEIQMQVSISARLNSNAPVAVEVVFPYDKALYQQLLKMDAKTWFAQRDQFMHDEANGKHLFDSWMWQWVPGQAVAAIPLEHRSGARGGLIFASYASSGAHRQSFDPDQNLRLDLGDQDFTLAQSN